MERFAASPFPRTRSEKNGENFQKAGLIRIGDTTANGEVMIESEEGMSEQERIQFEAETIRQFKGTDAYKLIRRAILGKIQERTGELLDRKEKSDNSIIGTVSEIRALNDVLTSIESYEARHDWWKKAQEHAESMNEEEMYVEPPTYYGSGAVM